MFATVRSGNKVTTVTIWEDEAQTEMAAVHVICTYPGDLNTIIVRFIAMYGATRID